ncbi:MAG TPA: hypothetical protein VMI31_07495 [Fimbriimonadaceae bacterium]|nr:hypothetical protein [Fimbriimonadaceae bacterium]
MNDQGDGRLSDSELDQIRERIGTRESGGVSIRDVAEASGLSVEEVAAHLDRIRAEASFSRPRKRTPIVPLLLCLAAVAIAAFSIVRSCGSESTATVVKYAPISGPGTPGIDGPPAGLPSKPMPSTGRAPANSDVEMIEDATGPDLPPPGIDVEVAGQTVSITATDRHNPDRSSHKLSYGAMVSEIEACLVKNSAKVQRRDKVSKLPENPGLQYDLNQNTYKPEPHRFHFAIGGDCKPVDGFLPFFANPPTRRQLEAADGVIESALVGREQDGSSPGEVLPPAGFAVTVYGRRVLTLSGSVRQSGKLDGNVLAKRLRQVVVEMLKWDHDEGTRIAFDASVTVESPKSWIRFDVPIAPTSRLGTDEAVRKAQTKAIDEGIRAAAEALAK